MIKEFDRYDLTEIKKVIAGADYRDLPRCTQDKVFDHFCQIGEMPQGTMKARTGDPVRWICCGRRLEQLAIEIEAHVTTHCRKCGYTLKDGRCKNGCEQFTAQPTGNLFLAENHSSMAMGPSIGIIKRPTTSTTEEDPGLEGY